jgi:hypothetical protein
VRRQLPPVDHAHYNNHGLTVAHIARGLSDSGNWTIIEDIGEEGKQLIWKMEPAAPTTSSDIEILPQHGTSSSTRLIHHAYSPQEKSFGPDEAKTRKD